MSSAEPSIVALVPMRHVSQRVPGKNYRLFAGQPLYHHILTALTQCSSISQIVVDTNSPTIKHGLRKHFPSVRIIDRPANLTPDTVPMNDVILHDISQVKADFYVQTHCTNPLLRPETIEQAITTFREHYPVRDSLFAVTRLQTRFWDQLGRAINHNPDVLLRTQDLPPVYEENSCLYIFSPDTLTTRHNRIGARPQLFPIDRLEATDIDEERDFAVAEFLHGWRQRNGVVQSSYGHNLERSRLGTISASRS